MSGNAIGAFFMPPLLEYLIQEYGLKGTLLITSALQLHVLVSACLFRPTEVHVQIEENDRKRAAKDLGDGASELFNLKPMPKSKSWSKFISIRSSDKLQLPINFSSIEPHELRKSDIDARELSSYRSMHLMGSIPNLKTFRASFLDLSNKDGETREHTSSRHPNIPHNASADQLVLQRRLRSDQPYGDDAASLLDVRRLLHEPLLEVDSESNSDLTSSMKKTMSPLSSPKEVSLRKFAVSNCVAQQEKNKNRQFVGSADRETSTATEIVSGNSSGVSLKPSSASASILPRLEEYNNSQASDFKRVGSQNSGTIALTPKKSHNPVVEFFKSFLKAIKACFSGEVLRTKKMILMTMSNCLMSFGAPHGLFYLHAYYKSVNMPSAEVTSLLSIISVADFTGRISIGFLADAFPSRLPWIYFVW